MIANTYILEDKGCIVAYYSLLNDKVSKMDATNSAWKRVKKLFHTGLTERQKELLKEMKEAK